MTISAENSAVQTVYFDPYDVELNADPYPMFRRLREEQPLYYNEQHDFYALSRFADVEQARSSTTRPSAPGAAPSSRLIKANIEIPSGTLIFEDPPIHDIHRKLLARMFTPRKINALEPKIREFCASSLDPLVGAGRFDFVNDLGARDADAGDRHAARHPRGGPGGDPRLRSNAQPCAPRPASP